LNTPVLKVIALLDKPSAHSMGVLPTVIESADGQLRISGFASARPYSLQQSELDELLSAKQALAVEPALPHPETDDPIIAAWIGRHFAKNAAQFGLPLPEFPEPSRAMLHGSFSLSTPALVVAKYCAWLQVAFKKAIATKNTGIATLMVQVFPDHELTRAALWYTASAADRIRELAWIVRLEQGAGRACSAAELEAQFQELCIRQLH
jgi:hypothetical protein